jgi:hypothetical protein
MQPKVLFITLTIFIISSVAGLAVENKGSVMLTLEGGKQGAVAFPHHQHQTKLDDCQVCHGVFPQTKGAIKKMKAEGKLKPKAVMNKQCVKCHRKERKAGNASGPVTCVTCHKR